MAVLSLFLCSTGVAIGQPIFADSFEDRFGFPESDREAARFLMQTTFGIKTADIDSVKRLGYRGWIRQQKQLPITLVRPELEAIGAAAIRNSQLFSQRDRDRVWHRSGVTANDQLRQRISFAFSEIFVISAQDASLGPRSIPMGEFQDLLARHAFGNYRDLLEAVTRDPVMARYLSSLRNLKRELVRGSDAVYYTPDENYAREVMQLFSIGVFERNQDFSLIDGSATEPGIQPMLTFDENIVANLARVFTGWGMSCESGDQGEVVIEGFTIRHNCGIDFKPRCVGSECNFISQHFLFDSPAASGVLVHPNNYSSMVCYPRFHDIGRNAETGDLQPERPGDGPYTEEPYRDKRIVGYWPGIGSGTLPPMAENCADLANINVLRNPTPEQLARRDRCVSYCEDELASALDALFYHPNTAPIFARRMIQFFVTSNPSSEYIERVADVFDDNGLGVRGDIGAVIEAILMDVEARQPVVDNNFGKVREPLIKLTALLRGLDFESPSGVWGDKPSAKMLEQYGQAHMRSPTVFNFFSPDYQPPGALADANLFAPELEIFDETRSILTGNALFQQLCFGYGGVDSRGASTSNCSSFGFTFVAPEDQAYLPPSVLDGLPTESEALIEQLNIRLLAGQMSGSYVANSGLKGVLRRFMEADSDIPKRLQLLNLIQLIVLSPEYSIQH